MLKTLHTWHNEEFLKLLRSSRARKRLRQTDLAQRLGRDQPTVSKVESGVRRLDVIELRAWLHALDIDFLAFMAELNENLALRQVADPRLGAKAQRKGREPARLVERERRG
jgi:transcriptional regulator with XRE-family HTH domain